MLFLNFQILTIVNTYKYTKYYCNYISSYIKYISYFKDYR